jgi:UDP-N-acetylglucosamine 1-carboxyvinyltransferase
MSAATVAGTISEEAADEARLTYRIAPARLRGTVRVSGAKNSVLRLMAASLLTPERITLANYPSDLRDAVVHAQMLVAHGKTCDARDGVLTITETQPLATDLRWLGRSIRKTLLILGALTARFGLGAVPLPGGCDIGDEPPRQVRRRPG